MKLLYSLLFVCSYLLSEAQAQQIRIKSPFRPGIDMELLRSKRSTPPQLVNGNIFCLNTYYADTTMFLDFAILLGPGDENGDSVYLQLPSGFTIVSSPTDTLYPVTQGQEPEVLRSITDSAIAWGDNDNTAGGIETETPYFFTLLVTIGSSVMGTQLAGAHISGDGTGSNPLDWNGLVNIYQHNSNSNPDLVVVPLQFSRYFSVPLPHRDSLIFPAFVANTGADLWSPKNLVYTDSLEGFKSVMPIRSPLAANDYDTVFSEILYPQFIGLHTIMYHADNITDENLENNYDTTYFYVSDSVFARTLNDTSYCIPLNGQGFRAGYGTWHELKSQDTLTSVTFFLKAPVPGAIVNATVHSFTTTPGPAIAITSNNTIIDGSAQWVTLYFDPHVILPKGRFFVSVNQMDTNSLGLAITDYNYLPNATFINFGTGWQTLESIDSAFTLLYFIQPNFGVGIYTPPVDPDLVVETQYPLGLFAVPFSQVEPYDLSARISNRGAELDTTVKVEFTVLPQGFTTYGTIESGLPLFGDTLVSGANAYLPAEPGPRQVLAVADIDNDANPANNTDTITFVVTDSTLTRSDFTFLTAVPFGPNTDLSGGVLPPANVSAGTLHVLAMEDTLTSVIIAVAGAGENDRYYVTFHPVVNDLPDMNTVLASTDTVITVEGQVGVLLPADTGAFIFSDSIFAMVHAITADDQSAALLVSPNVYTPGADVIYYPAGVPEYEHITFEDVELYGTFFIALNFARYSGVGIYERSAQKLLVYPNPARDRVLIQAEEGASVSIWSSLGMLVQGIREIPAGGQLSVSDLPAGNYIVRVTGKNHVACAPLIIIK